LTLSTGVGITNASSLFRIQSQRNLNKSSNTPIMNKAELIEAVQKTLGGETSKRAAGDAVEAVLTAIAKGVAKSGTVQLIGFGTFKVAKRAARTGRNPKTGEAMKIKASKTVRFVPSSALKGSL
jgi:DNA-binding protein HU-beta